jgi:predicted N-acetyltransferase YhbS
MAPSLVSRAYAGAADLRQMQAALARAYAITSLRVGDVAWLSRYHTHRELGISIRLWEASDGAVVGWTYYRATGGFNLFVAPGWGEPALLDEMLAGLEAIAAAAEAAGDAPVRLRTYGLDLGRSDEDRALAAALERHGYALSPGIGGVLTRALDATLPAPVLPPGYRLGWVETREQVIGRVEVHRLAFAPSDLVLAAYERVRRAWPYRPELDRVVLTDDGTGPGETAGEVVAFCTAWIDAENVAGLLEPVGTHPDHQRRGLARAVCLDALHQLRAAGARTAQVGYGSAAGEATYRSLGFEHLATDLVYRRAPA